MGINRVPAKNQINCLFWVNMLTTLCTWAGEQNPVTLEDMLILGDHISVDRFEEPPLSAQLFLSREIEERRVKSVRDLMDDIPNFHVSSGSGTSFRDIISFRGLTNTLVFGNSPVSIYVDDVPFGDPVTFANHLYGVERIEVFRGPQSALYGKNSYGGALNVISHRPGDELQSTFSVEGGNIDYRKLNGIISGPLVQDRLSFSLAGAYSKRDGFLKNTFLDTRPDNQEYTGGRGFLIWTPSDAWNIKFTGSVDNFNNNAVREVPLDGEPFTVQSDLHGKTKQIIDTQSLKIRYIDKAFEVLSVTARRNWKLNPFEHDLDLTSAPIGRIETRENVEQLSQEFRIQSTDTLAEWDWRIGVFGLFNDDNISNVLTLLNNSDISKDKVDENSYAGFAYINYKGFENTELNVGVRMDYVESSIDRTRQGELFDSIPSGLEKQQNSFFLSARKLALAIRCCHKHHCMVQLNWLLNRADSPPRI